MTYVLPKWYLSSRKNLKSRFTPDNFQSKEESRYENHVFIIEKFKFNLSNYFKGTIGKVQIESTAYDFWHIWVKNSKGLFLICNQDPQGYTIIDIKNDKKYSYIDPKAREGWGFNWKIVKPSPNGNYLAVQGDYIESGQEIILYDFRNPTKLPLPKIKKLELGKGSSTLEGWNGNDTVIIEHKSSRQSKIIEISI